MNVERAQKSTIVNIIIAGALAFFLLTVAYSVSRAFGDRPAHDMSLTVEMVRTGDDAITFRELTRQKNGGGFQRITGYCEIISAVYNRFGTGGTGIKVVLTDEEFSEVYKYEMLAGMFPDSRTVGKGEAHAVISDKLAVKLFKTIDVIGSKINVLGKEYTVCGIYKSGGSILFSMCGDGFDRVFVPYTSTDNSGEKPADVIALVRNPKQNIVETKNALDRIFGGKTGSYKIINHHVSKVVMRQYFDLLVFAIGVAAILNTLIFLAKYAVNTAKSIKKKSESYYVTEILKAGKKTAIAFLAVVLTCVACIVLLIKNIRFEFIIADRYIPADNIFDIGFYAEVLMNDVRTANSYPGAAYSVLQYTYKNLLAVELACVCISMLLLCMALTLRKILLALGAGMLRMLKVYSAIILAGGAAGICASAFLGLGVHVPVKLIIITAYYLIPGTVGINGLRQSNSR